jgi:hypothetical protein
VEAANKTLACTWKPDSLYFDTDCAAWKAWTTSSDIFKSAGADATFVNFLEDSDVKVRLLGAYHLGVDSERKWVNDAALSGRVIAAAVAETVSHWEIDEHGKAIARIQYAKTGNWAQAKAALDGTTLKTLVQNALDTLLEYNETNADVWEYVKGKTKDADKTVAKWALYGFQGLSTRKQEACKVFSDYLADDKLGPYVASALAYQSNECTTFLDAVLDQTEKSAKAGNISDSDSCYAMGRVTTNIKSTDAQKKRAVKVLNEILDNKHIEGYLRGAALRNLWDSDHAKAKAAAAKYAKDQNSSLAGAAKDILAKT